MDPKHNSGHNIILDFVAMLYIRFKDHFQTFKNFIQILDKIDVGDRIIKTKLIGDDLMRLHYCHWWQFQVVGDKHCWPMQQSNQKKYSSNEIVPISPVNCVSQKSSRLCNLKLRSLMIWWILVCFHNMVRFYWMIKYWSNASSSHWIESLKSFDC